MRWSRKQKGPIDPYVPRWGEVVLTGFDPMNELCYQEVLSYEEYYEEVGHVFDSAESIAKHGIRRLHLVIWDSMGRIQKEAENEYDANGFGVAGRRRDRPDQPWVEDKD